ncbi:hypothetical protein [Bacillus tropicus]|uniref:hypothetical protein n=1 Tax=Bacillus tropicus TaxID=2026188 RepID=UPI001C94A687
MIAVLQITICLKGKPLFYRKFLFRKIKKHSFSKSAFKKYITNSNVSILVAERKYLLKHMVANLIAIFLAPKQQYHL